MDCLEDEKYLFYGFLPKKEKELEKTIQKLKKLDFSIVFFVPSTKIKMCLLKFNDHFKNSKILMSFICYKWELFYVPE